MPLPPSLTNATVPLRLSLSSIPEPAAVFHYLRPSRRTTDIQRMPQHQRPTVRPHSSRSVEQASPLFPAPTADVAPLAATAAFFHYLRPSRRTYQCHCSLICLPVFAFTFSCCCWARRSLVALLLARRRAGVSGRRVI